MAVSCRCLSNLISWLHCDWKWCETSALRFMESFCWGHHGRWFMRGEDHRRQREPWKSASAPEGWGNRADSLSGVHMIHITQQKGSQPIWAKIKAAIVHTERPQLLFRGNCASRGRVGCLVIPDMSFGQFQENQVETLSEVVLSYMWHAAGNCPLQTRSHSWKYSVV